MEESETTQRMQIASNSYPQGVKVYNTKIGNVGIVCGSPIHRLNTDSIFIPVSYAGDEHLEDIETLVVVIPVKRGTVQNT